MAPGGWVVQPNSVTYSGTVPMPALTRAARAPRTRASTTAGFP